MKQAEFQHQLATIVLRLAPDFCHIIQVKQKRIVCTENIHGFMSAGITMLHFGSQREIPPWKGEQGHEGFHHVQPNGNNHHPHSKMASSAAPL